MKILSGVLLVIGLVGFATYALQVALNAAVDKSVVSKNSKVLMIVSCALVLLGLILTSFF